jgi:UDP-glucose 4-epimerase
MRVVVFGGSGFIGSHVADELTERGHEVVIYDLKTSPYLKEGQEMVMGDILDSNKVCSIMKDCDVAYNFAGIADLDTAVTKPVETVYQNVLGNTFMLDAAVEAKVKRFVYASTIYVYSSLGGFYRCSKQAAELYIEEYQRRYGLDFTILRYGTAYGPRAGERNSVYRYLKQALLNRKIICYGTGEELREYVHVRDVAKLSVDILSEKFKNKYVIITGHHPIKFKEMLNTIKEILGGEVEIIFRPPKEDPRYGAHYTITPYSFIPKIGQKLVSNYYIDLGQGLLECLQEISRKINEEAIERKYSSKS